MTGLREIGATLPVSAAALALDVAVLQTAIHFGCHYQLAAALGFVAGTFLAYALSIRYVFRFRRSSSPTVEFAVFATVGVAGLLINAVVIGFATGRLGMPVVVGKLASACCTFCFNFALRKSLLFSPSPAQPFWREKR